MAWTTPTSRTTGDLITASIWNVDLVANLIALRGGALALASQAALDLMYAVDGTSWARIPKGSALQSLRLNSGATAYEFATPATGNKDIVNGRLTLESGVPVSTSDQSAKTTIYFTPYSGNQIGLYDGAGSWNVITFSEVNIAASSITASKPADIWGYNNAGTLTLEATAWTSVTARATALALQDGVYVKSGATTRRYLGTVYINSDGIDVDDTLANPGVWNLYNRILRPVAFIGSGTATWVTPGGAYRATGNSAANSINILVGVAGFSALHLIATNLASLDDANGYMGSGIGIDSSTVNSAQLTTTGQIGTTVAASNPSFAVYDGYPAVGRRQYRWLEYGVSNSGTGTATIQMATNNGRNMGLAGVMDR